MTVALDPRFGKCVALMEGATIPGEESRRARPSRGRGRFMRDDVRRGDGTTQRPGAPETKIVP